MQVSDELHVGQIFKCIIPIQILIKQKEKEDFGLVSLLKHFFVRDRVGDMYIMLQYLEEKKNRFIPYMYILLMYIIKTKVKGMYIILKFLESCLADVIFWPIFILPPIVIYVFIHKNIFHVVRPSIAYFIQSLKTT